MKTYTIKELMTKYTFYGMETKIVKELLELKNINLRDIMKAQLYIDKCECLGSLYKFINIHNKRYPYYL